MDFEFRKQSQQKLSISVKKSPKSLIFCQNHPWYSIVRNGYHRYNKYIYVGDGSIIILLIKKSKKLSIFNATQILNSKT